MLQVRSVQINLSSVLVILDYALLVDQVLELISFPKEKKLKEAAARREFL